MMRIVKCHFFLKSIRAYAHISRVVVLVIIIKCRIFVQVPTALLCQTLILRNKQEAQLPRRNRASAMHFFVAKLFSIPVMSYSYVYHLRNLRPANLLRTQRINFSMRPQHVRMTRDPTVV